MVNPWRGWSYPGYQRFQLGAEGLDFLRESLSGGQRLCRLLLRALESLQGQVVTWLPEYVTNAQALDFDASVLEDPPEDSSVRYTDEAGQGFVAVPKPDADQALTDRILSFLKGTDEPLCLFAEHNSEIGGEWLRRWKGRVWNLEGEAVYVLGEENVDRSHVFATVKAARSWLFVAALLSPMVSDRPPVDRQEPRVSEDELARLLPHLEEIIVGAYDGEAYVMWQRTSR